MNAFCKNANAPLANSFYAAVTSPDGLNGIIDSIKPIGFENGMERFGIRDELLYTYSGAVLSQVSATPRVTQGYNPINTALGTYRYNAAGGLTYDSSRGITAITYNHFGQPLNTTASDAKRIYSAANTYTSQGTLVAWKHVQQSGAGFVTPVEECRKLGNFDYRKQGVKAFRLERADFAYGYFDGEGVHWTLTDAIGSIELVVSGDGRVEQHTGYYPYGQPWRAVAGQQHLFGGKELRTFAGLNDYDFHARFQNPAGPFFQSADRHATNDPARSPWTFAAANPVRFTDPSGLDNIDTAAADSTGMADHTTNYSKTSIALTTTSAFNAAQGIKKSIIEKVAKLATEEKSTKAAILKFGSKELVSYIKPFNAIAIVGSVAGAANTFESGYEYYQNGGRDPIVYLKLGIDLTINAASFFGGVPGATIGLVYFTANTAYDILGAQKKMEEQKHKAKK